MILSGSEVEHEDQAESYQNQTDDFQEEQNGSARGIIFWRLAKAVQTEIVGSSSAAGGVRQRLKHVGRQASPLPLLLHLPGWYCDYVDAVPLQRPCPPPP